MKICYLSSALIPADWAHVLQIMQMCEAFAQNGHEVMLLVPRRKGGLLQDPFEYAGVEAIFTIKRTYCLDLFPGSTSALLYWIRTISFYISARSFLSRKTFDIIYTRERFAPLFAHRCVYEIHAPSRNTRLDRRALSRVRSIVALTTPIKDVLIGRGYPSKKVTVEHDAVKLAPFDIALTKKEARAALGIPLDAYVVGYVGTLKTMGMEKGVQCAIRSLAQLPADVRLWVVGGEQSDIDECKALASSLSLDARVVFTGKVAHDKVPIYLKAFDVVVAPFPDFEHYRLYMSPLKIFEYMAAKVPMIVSDLPSLRDVLDENTAVFIPPNDDQALARAVTEMKVSPDRAKMLAAAAYEKVSETYTWQARARRIDEFIKTT